MKKGILPAQNKLDAKIYLSEMLGGSL